MQVVIDIDEEEYNCVKITGNIGNKTAIANAIYNGTVLSEPYGRLIDADKLFEKVGNIKPKSQNQHDDIGVFMNMITNAPTILKQEPKTGY